MMLPKNKINHTAEFGVQLHEKRLQWHDCFSKVE
jgi:hypothetical protein